MKKEHTKLLGFSLMELLVSVAIIGLVSAVVVFKQGDFSDQTSLSNVAHEIELQIREMQVYGTGVREYAPGSSDFNIAYGVDFNIGNSGSSNTSFVVFADKSPQNGIYDTPTQSCSPLTSPTPECILRYNLTRGNTISNLCAIQSNGTMACSLGRINVTYLRPSPDARIIFYNSSGSQVSYVNFQGARIELTSPKGKKQNIDIYTTGELAIQ